ncbi:PKD domain-containing protein [Conexibacter stalactiti]|uniref:PKD domain-containing protein n=1 Tax=Conexibacter stalactiti TaxID=1940611 RepID=A0ABU4HWV0_9ACTN|nr:PKD domain-containing protein [Conexibacter stalactiti]MDW5597797.1 hypothetical protein [Conexibacter stalactiti]MEC5038439.1 PKD domain-containing protein [Conexibacter stalactiti]
MSTSRSTVAVLIAVAAALLFGASAASAALQASFQYTPTEPRPGQQVEFLGSATGGAQAPVAFAWDLDGNGRFTDGEGPAAQRTFATAGTYVVRLRARQPGVAGTVESIAERTVVVAEPAPADPPTTPVDPPPADPAPPTTDPTPAPPPPPPADGNQPPVARYDRDCQTSGRVVLCAGLAARQSRAKLLSAAGSSDPDGQVVAYAWDLDGDGSFERESGADPTVRPTFERRRGLADNGKRTISVRVTDDDGATAVDTVTLRMLDPACEPLVVQGDLQLRASCLRGRNASDAAGRDVTRWTSRGAVVVNGVALEPTSGQPIAIDLPRGPDRFGVRATPHISSGRAKVSLRSDETLLTLYEGRIDWRVAKHQLFGFELSPGARLNGLRITGAPEPPRVGFGRFGLGVFVALPDQFGGATSAQPLQLRAGTGARAAATGPLSFTVPNAALGPIGLDTLKVTYDGVDLWEIRANVALPAPAALAIEGDAGIRSDGSFEHAGAAVDFGAGIEVGGPIPVFLKRIAFRVEVRPQKSRCVPHTGIESVDPALSWLPGVPDTIDYGTPTFALCGEVRLTAGPSILGAAAMSLDGGLGFATYDDRPWVMRAFGQLNVVEIPVARGELAVHGDGYVRMWGRYRWGIPDVVSVRGKLNLEMMGKKFNAGASGDACIDFIDWCRGMRGVVSSKGVAVCFTFDYEISTWEPGIGYVWGESFPDLYFDGCDVGDYRAHVAHGSRASAAAAGSPGEQVVEVAPGLPGVVFAAEGRDAPPKITLIGPKGERIETPNGPAPVEDDRFIVLQAPRGRLTQVAVVQPSAGRWRVVTQEGSSPITLLRTANGLEEPQVRATVGGTGQRRTIAYRIAPRAGQTVTFSERGASAGRILGVASGSAGTLRFTPAEGKRELREIVAVVEQDGNPRAQIRVASYRAPGALRPARAAGLRVRRAGGALRVRWSGQPGVRWVARVTLSDGRRLTRTTRARTLTVRSVARGVRARVTLTPFSASGVAGPVAKVRVS